MHIARASSAARQTWLPFAVLVALPLLVFSNTLENDYQLDSVYRLKRNTEIERFWPPWRFFLDRRTGSAVETINEYRPLMPLTHAAGVALADALEIDRRAVFHSGNIAVHVTTSLLLYLLFCELLVHWAGSSTAVGRRRSVALGAALLFAVHPVSGIPVNYMAGLDLLLMMMFLTAALLLFVRMRRRGDSVGAWAAILVLLGLSLLSKGNAMVAPGVVLLFELLLARTRPTDWRMWARVGAFTGMTVLYLVVQVVTAPPGHDNTPDVREIYYPLTMLKAHLFEYFRNFLWPFEIRMLPHVSRVEGWTDPRALVGAAFILSTLALAWFLRRRNALAAFAICAYWALFAVTSSIFAISNEIVQHYRQYPSLPFLCLAVSLGLSSLPRIAAMLAVPALAAYFGLVAHSLNEDWRDAESFWGQSVRYGGNALAHTNYGFAVVGRDPALAERHYLEALRLFPQHVHAQTNLGMLYVRQGRAEEGLELLRTAVRYRPDWGSTHYWLGTALLELGQREEGVRELEGAAERDPRSLQFQYEAARALQRAGQAPRSLRYLERVAAVDPGYRDTLFMVGFAHQTSGRGQEAVTAYRRFLRLQPDHAGARFNLGHALKQQDQCAAAVPHFERVLELDPGRAPAHLHLAKCYRRLGRTSEADEHEAAWRSAGS